MPFTEDLSAFFNPAEHATTVELDGVDVAAIFSNGSVVSEGGIGMITTDPMLTLATSDVPASPTGKTAVVGGVSYTIVGHDPDGTGISVLTLELA